MSDITGMLNLIHGISPETHYSVTIAKIIILHFGYMEKMC